MVEKRSSMKAARRSILFMFIFCALTSIAATQAPAQTGDWLRFVPGDIRFYVEVRDLVDLRRRLQRLGIWHTVRELADADGRTTSQPTSRLPGLDDEQAISQLIGRRGALFAPTSAEWKGGVLFAECGGPQEVQRWRVQWGARRQADVGPVQCYLLEGNLRMAVLGNLIVLGPAEDRSNLWGRSVQLMSGRAGSNLRGQSEFASLSARLSGDHDGIGFVAWKPGDPFALAGCERMLLGFSLDESQLHCEIHGHRPHAGDRPVPTDPNVFERLPDDTLAAWSDSFVTAGGDVKEGSAVLLDDYSPLGIFLGMFASTSNPKGNTAENLGPRYTVAVCPELVKRGDDQPRTPVLVLLMDARNAGMVAEQMEHILDFVTMVARFAMIKPGDRVPSFGTEKRMIDGHEVRVIALGKVLAERFDLPLLRPIEICWTPMEKHLIVATSTARMQGVLRTWRGEAAGLRRSDVLGGIDATESPVVQWGFLRGTQASELMRSWLQFVRVHHPEALKDEWWQNWAADRTRKRTRFGVSLKDSPGVEGGAEVLEIDAASPAAGLLQVGDVILAAGGRPLATSQPALETAKRYNERGRQRLFRLTVLRGGRRLTFGAVVEPLDLASLKQLEPVRAIRQLIKLLRRAESVRLVRRGLQPDWLHVSVSVDWNQTGGATSRPGRR